MRETAAVTSTTAQAGFLRESAAVAHTPSEADTPGSTVANAHMQPDVRTATPVQSYTRASEQVVAADVHTEPGSVGLAHTPIQTSLPEYVPPPPPGGWLTTIQAQAIDRTVALALSDQLDLLNRVSIPVVHEPLVPAQLLAEATAPRRGAYRPNAGDGTADTYPKPRPKGTATFKKLPASHGCMAPTWNTTFLQSWLDRHPNEQLREYLTDIFENGADTGVEPGTSDVTEFTDRDPPEEQDMTPDAVIVTQASVDKNLARGSIKKVDHKPYHFKYFPHFVAFDSSGKGRSVADMARVLADGRKPLNDLAEPQTLAIHQEQFPGAFFQNALADGYAFAIAIDVTSAYTSVRVRPEQQYLQAFRWKGESYVSLSMVFGQVKAGFDWSAVASILQYITQAELDLAFGPDECRCAHVGDDLVCLVRHAVNANAAYTIVRSVFHAASAPVAESKTQFSTDLTFVGLRVNLLHGFITLKEGRLEKTEAQIIELQREMTRGRVPRRHLRSFAGTLAFLRNQLEVGSSLAHGVYVAAHQPGSHTRVKVPQTVSHDLDVIARCLRLQKPRLCRPDRTTFLQTEASGVFAACGSYLCTPEGPVYYNHTDLGEQHVLHTKGKTTDVTSSSTLIETAGAAVALSAYAQQCVDSTVVVICDNQGTVAAINKMYSPIREISLVLSAIGCLSLKYDMHVRAVHRPRAFMAAADALSRHDTAKFLLAMGGVQTYHVQADMTFVSALMSGSTQANDIAALILHEHCNK